MITRDMLDNVTCAQECRRLVAEFFKDEPHKVDLWFRTPNPSFGGIKPNELIELGRAWKLLQFIENALAANRLPR